MIEAEGDLEIRRTPAEVFAAVCDLSQAPSWLESCTSLALEAPGAWARGATLQYAYRLGGHEGTMGGRVAEYEPPRALRMEFSDTLYAVSVSLSFAPVPAGTHVTHVIGIEVKGFAGKLMAPLIRVGNQKQVLANLGRLKQRLEAAD